MENKKIYLAVIGLLIILVVFLLAVVFFRLGANTAQKSILGGSIEKIQNQSQNSDFPQTIISEPEKIPSTVTGTVLSKENGEILIKQFANFDLNYKISKNEVKSVVSLEKNPNYNEEEARRKQEERQKQLDQKLKEAGIDIKSLKFPLLPVNSAGQPGETPEKTEASPQQPENFQTNQNVSPEDQKKMEEALKIIEEFNKEVEQNPFANEYIEKPISFEEVPVGAQVNYLKDAKEGGEIVVYPKEVNIGPPGSK